MSLESATYVNDLVTTNPTGADQFSQGDEHLRLIKQVLQNTLPDASKPLRAPRIISKTADYTVQSTDDQAEFLCSTGGGNFTLTLPTLTSDDAGWSIKVTKVSTDANGVKIVPPSGNIFARRGNIASVRVGVVASEAVLTWSGTNFICKKSGPNVGSVERVYDNTLPPGYLWVAGGTFNATDFAELAATLGGNILPDERGRIAICKDNLGGSAAGRLTSATMSPNGSTVGAVGGEERHQLTGTEVPSHVHGLNGTGAKATSSGAHTHDVPYTGSVADDGDPGNYIVTSPNQAFGNYQLVAASGGAHEHNLEGNTVAAGGDTPHNNIPPAIVCNMIMRAC